MRGSSLSFQFEFASQGRGERESDFVISLSPTLGKMGKTMAFCGATGALLWQPYRPLVFVGQSMSPTYRDGEIAMTISANPDDLRKGDVVIIEMPDGPIVKRIARLPGDTITQVCFDKEWNDLTEVNDPPAKSIDGRKYRKLEVPEGYVYVLGDNRVVSMDSRSFGAVPVSWISRKLLSPKPGRL